MDIDKFIKDKGLKVDCIVESDLDVKEYVQYEVRDLIKEAINYTHCCKSDSEQLQAFKKDDLVMLDGNLQVRVVIPEPKILISEDLGGAKMWVETHRCIKK